MPGPVLVKRNRSEIKYNKFHLTLISGCATASSLANWLNHSVSHLKMGQLDWITSWFLSVLKEMISQCYDSNYLAYTLPMWFQFRSSQCCLLPSRQTADLLDFSSHHLLAPSNTGRSIITQGYHQYVVTASFPWYSAKTKWVKADRAATQFPDKVKSLSHMLFLFLLGFLLLFISLPKEQKTGNMQLTKISPWFQEYLPKHMKKNKKRIY